MHRLQSKKVFNLFLSLELRLYAAGPVYLQDFICFLRYETSSVTVLVLVHVTARHLNTDLNR